jgi:DHA2 family multidrug resistance protein-like MFS transporter
MELFTDRPGDEGLPGRERCLAMISVMIATAMAVFDGSIVNIALPPIAQTLNVSAGEAVWVANGYLLSVAVTLAAFSALARRTGFRSQFTVGIAVFTLASLGCALSTSLPWLIAMRVLQGIGGAATLSIAPAIHRSIFPTRLLGRILGLNALLVATSSAVAPLLGGTLLAALSWQWLFAINVPLGIVGTILARRAIPKARVRGLPFDAAGALLSAAAMAALIMAADTCAQLGQGGQAYVPLAYAAVAVAAGMAFVRRQRRAPEPLLPLDIFASTRFSMAALTSMASFVGQGIAFISLPILLESAYGYSPFASALLFTPWPVAIVFVAPYAGRLADRHKPATLATAGLIVFAIGLALLALLPYNAPVWDIAWRELVCGAGFGFFQSPNNREMLANVSRERSSNASGVLAIARTFGQCLGTALVGVILSAYAAHVAAGGGKFEGLALAHAIEWTLWLAMAATVAALVISSRRLGSRQAAPGQQPS